MNSLARWNVVLVFAILACTASILVRMFARPKPYRYGSCLSNIKQLGLGVLMYANDYDDKLPKAAVWMDSIGEYTKGSNLYHDPELNGTTEYGYAFRDKASGIKSASVAKPAEFQLIFDSVLLGRNAHSEPSTMPHPGRHLGHNCVGYMDGHAKSLAMP